MVRVLQFPLAFCQFLPSLLLLSPWQLPQKKVHLVIIENNMQNPITYDWVCNFLWQYLLESTAIMMDLNLRKRSPHHHREQHAESSHGWPGLQLSRIISPQPIAMVPQDMNFPVLSIPSSPRICLINSKLFELGELEVFLRWFLERISMYCESRKLLHSNSTPCFGIPSTCIFNATTRNRTNGDDIESKLYLIDKGCLHVLFNGN